MSFVTGSRLKIIPTPQIVRCTMMIICSHHDYSLESSFNFDDVSICRLYDRINLLSLNATRSICVDTHQGDIKQVFKNTDNYDR